MKKDEALEAQVVDRVIGLLVLTYADSTAAVTLGNHRGIAEIWARSLIAIGRGETAGPSDEYLVAHAAEIMAAACAEGRA